MASPRMLHPQALADYLKIISRAVFSAGLSWAFIDGKWDGFEEAFHDFDPAWVAGLDEFAIESLAEDPRLYRSPKKIAATVHNAKALLALEAEFGSVRAWLDQLPSYTEATSEVSKRFKYLSKTFGAYYFLYIAGARPPGFPTFEEWSEQTGEAHPRMRELVEINENRPVGGPTKKHSRRKDKTT